MSKGRERKCATDCRRRDENTYKGLVSRCSPSRKTKIDCSLARINVAKTEGAEGADSTRSWGGVGGCDTHGTGGWQKRYTPSTAAAYPRTGGGLGLHTCRCMDAGRLHARNHTSR